MKCLKIRTALSIHTSPHPPLYWHYCHLPGPVARRHEYACFLYILNIITSSPRCKQTWQKGGWKNIKRERAVFKILHHFSSSFLMFWMVFLLPGTQILPGHLKGQKLPVISDEGPDVFPGFPIGCSLMGMREVMYLLSSIQKSQSVWLANPWLKK